MIGSRIEPAVRTRAICRSRSRPASVPRSSARVRCRKLLGPRAAPSQPRSPGRSARPHWQSWRGAGRVPASSSATARGPCRTRLFLRPMVQDHGVRRHPSRCHHDPCHQPACTRPNEGEVVPRRAGGRSLGDGQRAGRESFARDEAMHVDPRAHCHARHADPGSTAVSWRRSCASPPALSSLDFMAWPAGSGRKATAPGVAHHETIRTFNSPRFMEDPLAVQCNLVGNPLHEGQARDRAPARCLLHALNTVIDEDRDRHA